MHCYVLLRQLFRRCGWLYSGYAFWANLFFDLLFIRAIELANIYAWTIDFYRIQKGDKFKAIFEEVYADGEYIGVGEIKAALFNHSDEEFYAFYFVQDSIGDYFDEEAKSLRKAFLKMPLNT